jgi:hypothetical protein
LEAAVDVAAEVRKLEGAVGEIRERRRGGSRWNWKSEIEGGRNQQNGTKCFDDRGGFACPQHL